MYLKEIQAQGFKSFADKLDITLDKDITCVVGPNGSGKSNVVDAVRWVLGEQSVKALRGTDTMTDVIFSGSKSRNSLNVAQVTLIFDNTDNYLHIPYTEVSVKRRLYRSGENEYFLNGEKCRLKDIIDLFLDTGIGKESLNIIGQGEVGKIISNSPYDRRIIIESAAGVLKYKKRKEEAIRKLDKTNTNLDRVLDIINEIELRLEPLKEQSLKAKEYLENKNALEKIEVALIKEEIESLNNLYQSSKERIEILKEEILKLESESLTKATNVDNLKVKLIDIDKEIRELNNNILIKTEELEKINTEKQMLLERSKYDFSSLKVHENIKSLKEEVLKASNNINILDKEIELDNKELASIYDNLNNKTNKITSLDIDKNNVLKELNDKKRENYDLDNKIASLTDFIENGANLPNGIKYLINNPKIKGIHDIIGNIIEIDYKFIKALDIALSFSKNYLIVDNSEVAKECINYLKNNNLGRVTFYPLDVIKGRKVDIESLNILRKEVGFIDTFNNIVKYDNKYKNIIDNVLGNVLLVTDIDKANLISKKISNKYKIVTIDGEVFNVGGSITGGTIKENRNILLDKQELNNLLIRFKANKEILNSLEIKLDEIDKEISKELKQKEEIQNSYIFNKQLLNNKNIELNNIKERYNELNSELNSLNSLKDNNLSKEEDILINKYYEKDNELKELKLKLNSLNKLKDNISKEIDEQDALSRLNNSSLNKLNNELKDLEVNISKMDVKLDYYLNTLAEEYEMTYERAKNEYHLDCDIKEAREKVNTYKANIKRIGMVSLDSIEEYEKTNERYTFLTSQRQDLLDAKETLLEIINEMDSIMKEEFKNTFNKVEIEFQNVFNKLFGGGKAELKLTDPNNLLESGVEIIASPPGKKLTAITLLSGGEKTLTAISLLFAILNVSPIPFCIFDEVEAALDEANVSNFGKYLETYKEKTQFLLITHKKKTMEYAKTLYGITMQESGVSKLVSVKLEDN